MATPTDELIIKIQAVGDHHEYKAIEDEVRQKLIALHSDEAKVSPAFARRELKRLQAMRVKNNIEFILTLLENVERMGPDEIDSARLFRVQQLIDKALKLLPNHGEDKGKNKLLKRLDECLENARSMIMTTESDVAQDGRKIRVVPNEKFNEVRMWVLQQEGSIPLATMREKIADLKTVAIETLRGESEPYGVPQKEIDRILEALWAGCYLSDRELMLSEEWYDHNIEQLEMALKWKCDSEQLKKYESLRAELDLIFGALHRVRACVHMAIFGTRHETVEEPFTSSKDIPTLCDWARRMYKCDSDFRLRVHFSINSYPGVANTIITTGRLASTDCAIEDEFNHLWPSVNKKQFERDYEAELERLRTVEANSA